MEHRGGNPEFLSIISDGDGGLWIMCVLSFICYFHFDGQCFYYLYISSPFFPVGITWICCVIYLLISFVSIGKGSGPYISSFLPGYVECTSVMIGFREAVKATGK